jgi:uncharacterized protein (TIGR03083 family)
VTLPRDEVSEGLQQGLVQFEEFIRTLDDSAWNSPTRCEGWAVADVAAHVTGTMTMITQGRVDELADPTHVERQTAERKGRSPQEVADELRDSAKLGGDILGTFDEAAWNGPAPAGLPGTLGEGVEALWYDAYLHLEDIKAALAQSPARGPGLKAAVEHVSTVLDRDGWGPATLALDGFPEQAIGAGDNPKRITGDPLTFVLVATGREDPSVLGLDETVNIYRAQ